MTQKRLKSITADELMTQLEKDEGYQARVRAQDTHIEKAAAERSKEEEPLVGDLRKSGVDVDSVWDLVNSSAPYPDAVPVLLDHLRKPYSERLKEGIARALAVPEARSGWPVLVSEFEKSLDPSTRGAKWGLACALRVAGHDGVMDDILRLLQDTRHGRNRAPLLDVLGRSAKPSARATLSRFAKDPELGKDARKILSNSG